MLFSICFFAVSVFYYQVFLKAMKKDEENNVRDRN